MCLKFQLTRTSTRPSVAVAMCWASTRLFALGDVAGVGPAGAAEGATAVTVIGWQGVVGVHRDTA